MRSWLGKMEHARWNWQRIMQDWIYAPGDKDADNKTTPYLVPWVDLPPEIQEYDLETVRLIPTFLYLAGYEAYPLDGHPVAEKTSDADEFEHLILAE